MNSDPMTVAKRQSDICMVGKRTRAGEAPGAIVIGGTMDFLCYLHPGWRPAIRPAPSGRPWMDNTPEAFAYRCLPLNIANAHGWEILSPCDAAAWWTGGPLPRDVLVRAPGAGESAPVALFGQGVLTFHIQGLFRTPPGWDLWVGGSPNRLKDGIAPLTGVVETDWSPYTFTMNWKFTRRNHIVRFEKGEPICFIFPVRRDALELMDPKFVPLTEGSDLVQQFRAWSQSRTAFQAEMATPKPRAPSEQWQKRYYRGVTMRDGEPIPGHRTKLRLRPFADGVPSAEPPLAADERLLETLLIHAARGLREGRDPAALARELRSAGIPPATADRLASAAIAAMGAATETDVASAVPTAVATAVPTTPLGTAKEIAMGIAAAAPPV